MATQGLLRAESLKRLLQGAVVGAVATLAIGFGWAGFTLGSTAGAMADAAAKNAVVAAMAPICVDQFQRATGAAENLSALKKTGAWEQAAFVEKGGWAVMPGSNSVESGVTNACATLLNNLK